MQTRRTFMKSTAIAATFVGPMAAHAASLPGASARAPVAIGFFDEDLGKANGFATALAANGADAVAVGSDVTGLWLRAMRESGSIVGLTRPGTLFCVQQMSPASGRIVTIHRTIFAEDALKLRRDRAGAFESQLAGMAFETLSQNRGLSVAVPKRSPAARLPSHGSDELILWVSSPTSIG